MASPRTAIFPVAGLGTRFLPATKAVPKEMLPIIDKPLIQYAVEEAAAAGIERFVFITGRNKGAIEDHFEHQLELNETRASAAARRSWKASPRSAFRRDAVRPAAAAAGSATPSARAPSGGQRAGGWILPDLIHAATPV
jgi:UTP--glucose-1-phosphate uridylyltransferase